MALDGEKKEKMQALSLAKECYAMKLDLLSSATVVDKAVKFVDNHKDKSRSGSQDLIDQNMEVTIEYR
jgi:hypothetical protein